MQNREFSTQGGIHCHKHGRLSTICNQLKSKNLHLHFMLSMEQKYNQMAALLMLRFIAKIVIAHFHK